MKDELTTGDPEQQPKQDSPRFKRRLQKNASRLLAAGLLALFLAAAYFAVASVVIPKRYDLAIGAIATETISAPREIIDEVTTQERELSAEYAVVPVLELDMQLVQSAEDAATAYFDALGVVRVEAGRIRTQQQMQGAGAASSATADLQADDWRSILADADFAYLKSFLPIEFADIEVLNILLANDSEIRYLSDAVLVKIKMALRGGLDEAGVERAQTSILREVDAMNMSEDLKRIAAKAVNRYVAPTLVKDEEETLARQRRAVENVQPVVFKRGDTIIRNGEAVTPAQLAVLQALGVVRPAEQDLALYFGVGITLLVLTALFGAYILLNRREVLERPFMLWFLMLATLALVLLSIQIDNRLNLTFIGVMLISLMVSRHVAVAVNIAFAFICALLSGGQELFGSFAFEVLATTLAGGTVGVYLQRRAQRRATMMLSGVLGGVTAAALMAAMSLMTGVDLGRSLISALFVLGSYTISTVICIGTLPLWETLFDITTDSRLMELSNANHPALKRLMTEAPGTYHHAMMVAAIAEAGADAIGANGILARVGGYYHDLGKLRRPQMFMENIKGENPHDSMPAEASAGVILSHVRDGVAYAQKYKLPSAIQQIIYEHHGTTPVLFFYNKALQEANGKPVNLKHFRYPGARPRTRESAIVMLADSVEAAVRSLPDNSRTSVEQMIRKIIKGKVEDEQLMNCPLTFAHLSAIERAFIASYDGIMHERIEYPNMPLLEDKS